jgi:hypothetical protein
VCVSAGVNQLENGKVSIPQVYVGIDAHVSLMSLDHLSTSPLCAFSVKLEIFEFVIICTKLVVSASPADSLYILK